MLLALVIPRVGLDLDAAVFERTKFDVHGGPLLAGLRHAKIEDRVQVMYRITAPRRRPSVSDLIHLRAWRLPA